MKKLYQWGQWFGRPRTVLVRGIHYHCSQSTMVQMIRNTASAREVKVRLTDSGSHITIEVLSDRTEEGAHEDEAEVPAV